MLTLVVGVQRGVLREHGVDPGAHYLTDRDLAAERVLLAEDLGDGAKPIVGTAVEAHGDGAADAVRGFLCLGHATHCTTLSYAVQAPALSRVEPPPGESPS